MTDEGQGFLNRVPESLQWCWGRVLGFVFEGVLGITTLVMEHPSLEANIARDEMDEVREEEGDGEIQFATAFIPFIPPVLGGQSALAP